MWPLRSLAAKNSELPPVCSNESCLKKNNTKISPDNTLMA
jgi:hypothetical protein